MELIDSKEARARRQSKRRKQLNAIAALNGFETWSKFETAAINREIIVKVQQPGPADTGKE